MLIIGNSGYVGDQWPELPNATNDAEAVCRAFASQGFRVIKVKDASRAETTAAISQFAQVAANADTAVFYFAGHGFEYAGTNFLVPVDAPLSSSRAQLASQFVDLAGAVKAVMKAKHAIVFLDACRTRDPIVTVTDANPNGPEGPVGNINLPDTFEGVVFYSTARGRPAFDAAPADRSNSPFAEAVISRLGTPNLELNRYFAFVRQDVKERTLPQPGGPQIPTPYGVLAEDYFFQRHAQQQAEGGGSECAESGTCTSEDLVCQLSGECGGEGKESDSTSSRGFKIARKSEGTAGSTPARRPATAAPSFGSRATVPRTETRPTPTLTGAPNEVRKIADAVPGRAKDALASLTEEVLQREDEPLIIGRLLGKATAQEIAVAAAAGQPVAQYLYGSMLYQGIGVSKDLDAARRILAEAALGGTPAAQLEYGFFLDNYGNGAADKAEALKLYEAAAAQDWPKAQSHLAYRLWSSKGPEKDSKRALSLWRKAAAGGHAYGWYALAAYGGQFQEARAGLKSLASAGDPAGHAWLCEVENAAQTPRAGMEACLAAAQEGYAGPMAILALIYGTGQFGPGSAKEARYWAKLALSKPELDPQYRTALQPLASGK